MSRYANRLSEIEEFRVMKLLARANALAEQGHDIVRMVVGEPDFTTPRAIVSAGAEALAAGKTKYTAADGVPELKRAISDYYQSDYGVTVDVRRIFITAGGSGALLLATAMCLNVGESLLMTDPGYPCNRHFLKSFSSDAVLVPVSAEDNYQLKASDIDQYWQAGTKGVLLGSPANPTGSVLNLAELEAIAEKVLARNGHVIVDEIYHGLSYSDSPLVTGLQVSDQVMVLNSFSKYFGMTGWRLGWLVVPEDAIELTEKLAQNLFICASSIAQYAALAAFTPEARREMEGNRAEFHTRRDYLLGALQELGFNIPNTPEGAFYIYVKLPDYLPDSEPLCDLLLESYGLAITPGTDFGFFEAERHVRFSYAQNLTVLKHGIEKLRRALADIRCGNVQINK